MDKTNGCLNAFHRCTDVNSTLMMSAKVSEDRQMTSDPVHVTGHVFSLQDCQAPEVALT